jgi:hypothetical protein
MIHNWDEINKIIGNRYFPPKLSEIYDKKCETEEEREEKLKNWEKVEFLYTNELIRKYDPLADSYYEEWSGRTRADFHNEFPCLSLDAVNAIMSLYAYYNR